MCRSQDHGLPRAVATFASAHLDDRRPLRGSGWAKRQGARLRPVLGRRAPPAPLTHGVPVPAACRPPARRPSQPLPPCRPSLRRPLPPSLSGSLALVSPPSLALSRRPCPCVPLSPPPPSLPAPFSLPARARSPAPSLICVPSLPSWTAFSDRPPPDPGRVAGGGEGEAEGRQGWAAARRQGTAGRAAGCGRGPARARGAEEAGRCQQPWRRPETRLLVAGVLRALPAATSEKPPRLRPRSPPGPPREPRGHRAWLTRGRAAAVACVAGQVLAAVGSGRSGRPAPT
jgi:hypothetical protein